MNMETKPFSYNSNAKYPPSARYAASKVVLTNTTVQVQTAGGFQALFPDVFEKYRLPTVYSDLTVQDWNSKPMQFWQKQLNFAVWCATTGCGVSANDHLATGDPMIRSLYLFHAYYQTRRILTEMRTPLPQDQAWNAFNNMYDRRAYERICNEFGVDPSTDWSLRYRSRGLGEVYNYSVGIGYATVREEYDPRIMKFPKDAAPDEWHIDFIKQDAADAGTAWRTLILDKSEGLTRPGVERLNDSIRTYVWAILGAQGQTRTGIISGNTTAFDAQKQFLANIEDAISSPVDLPSAIKRYQDVLRYAGSEVNFVFGIGLYMAPSDMLLRVGTVAGYNNEIVVATSAQTLGVNSDINLAPPPPPPTPGLIKPLGPTPAKPPPAPIKPPPQPGLQQHVDERTALIVGGVAVGLFVLWLVL